MKSLKGSRKRAFVLDIASASVAGAVVDVSEDGKPALHHLVRVPMAFQEKLDFERFLKAMGTALDTVMKDLRDNGLPKAVKAHGHLPVSQVFCSLASPWYGAETKVSKSVFQEPTQVTKKHVDALVQDAAAGFDVDHGKLKSGDSELLEQQLFDIRLNGYSTRHPYGKPAVELSTALFLSHMSKAAKEEVERVVRSYTQAPLSYHAFSYVAFSVIRSLFRSDDHYFILDVSGEVSDISLISENLLLDTASFPLGHNFLLRAIMEKHKVTPQSARSMLTLAAEGKGTEGTTREELSVTLNKAALEWSQSLKNALTEFAKTSPLPSTIFLSAGADFLFWYREVLETSDWSDLFFVQKPFIVHSLNREQLFPCCTLPDESFDPFLIVGSIFLNQQVFIREKPMV